MREALKEIYRSNEDIIKRKRKFRTEEDMLKYFLKRGYKATHRSSPKKMESLLVTERICYDDDNESIREYGFIIGAENVTDEEIEECCRDEWIRINSPYDCTGKWFTARISWHRNPSGLVSYIHEKWLDV